MKITMQYNPHTGPPIPEESSSSQTQTTETTSKTQTTETSSKTQTIETSSSSSQVQTTIESGLSSHSQSTDKDDPNMEDAQGSNEKTNTAVIGITIGSVVGVVVVAGVIITAVLIIRKNKKVSEITDVEI